MLAVEILRMMNHFIEWSQRPQIPLTVLICELNLSNMTITRERHFGHSRLLRYFIIILVGTLDWLCLAATCMPHKRVEMPQRSWRIRCGFKR